MEVINALYTRNLHSVKLVYYDVIDFQKTSVDVMSIWEVVATTVQQTQVLVWVTASANLVIKSVETEAAKVW